MVAGCAPLDEPKQANDARPTIVSLNPCSDAILAEVAAPEELLALSHYSHDPRATSMDLASARQFAITGGTVEEVLALDPDVVVASSFLPATARAAYEELGIRVVSVGITSNVAASDAQIRELAKLAGDVEAGEALIAKIAQSLAASAPGDAPPISAVLWQPSGIVPGDTALVSELMQRTGFTNHSAARGYGQADYMALEEMLIDPPKVLIVAGQEAGQSHPSLRAVPNMARAELAPNLLYCGGPTIIRAVERLKALRDGLSASGFDPSAHYPFALRSEDAVRVSRRGRA